MFQRTACEHNELCPVDGSKLTWILVGDNDANKVIGEGNFDDQSAKASGAATPVPSAPEPPTETKKKGGRVGTGKSKKAKTAAQRLAIIDAAGDLGMGGGM